MKTTRKWGGILSRIPETDPQPVEGHYDEDDKVVRFKRPTPDEMWRRLIDAQNAVIDKGAGAERAAMAYNSALDHLQRERAIWQEMQKEIGARLEYTQNFPEIDVIGNGGNDGT